VTWGLRDYNIEPQVWDANPDCEHVWGEESKTFDPVPPKYRRCEKCKKMVKTSWLDGQTVLAKCLICGIETKYSNVTTQGPQQNQDKNRWIDEIRHNAELKKANVSQGQFCQHCQAWKGSLGLEPDPESFIRHIVQVFREVKRVLHKSGTVWLNMGDSYNSQGPSNHHKSVFVTGNPKGTGTKLIDTGLKPKDLCGIPWRVALALQADGWWLRSGLPWVKRSAMPESCTDRPASALEYMFLLAKSQHYFFDMDAVRVDGPTYTRKAGGYKNHHNQMIDNYSPFKGKGGFADSDITTVGRNYRNTDIFYESIKPPHGMIFCGDEPVGLDVNPQAFSEAHFATFPEKLVEPCLKAGTSLKGCCPECLAPWERVVEKGKLIRGKANPYCPDRDNREFGEQGWNKEGGYGPGAHRESKTIGWKPGCECYGFHLKPLHLDPVLPCTVLDPFFGSGTVAIVAEKHRRNWAGIELSKTYAALAEKRVRESIKQRCLF